MKVKFQSLRARWDVGKFIEIKTLFIARGFSTISLLKRSDSADDFSQYVYIDIWPPFSPKCLGVSTTEIEAVEIDILFAVTCQM